MVFCASVIRWLFVCAFAGSSFDLWTNFFTTVFLERLSKRVFMEVKRRAPILQKHRKFTFIWIFGSHTAGDSGFDSSIFWRQVWSRLKRQHWEHHPQTAFIYLLSMPLKICLVLFHCPFLRLMFFWISGHMARVAVGSALLSSENSELSHWAVCWATNRAGRSLLR